MQMPINKNKMTATIIMAILITSTFMLLTNFPVQAQGEYQQHRLHDCVLSRLMLPRSSLWIVP